MSRNARSACEPINPVIAPLRHMYSFASWPATPGRGCQRANTTAAAQLRCEAPLSTIQKTRLAEAYGSVYITWLPPAGERLYPGGRLAPAPDLGAVDIVGGHVGEGAVAVVLALGPHHPSGPRRERRRPERRRRPRHRRPVDHPDRSRTGPLQGRPACDSADSGQTDEPREDRHHRARPSRPDHGHPQRRPRRQSRDLHPARPALDLPARRGTRDRGRPHRSTCQPQPALAIRGCPRGELNHLPTPACCPPTFSLVARHDRPDRQVEPANHYRMRRHSS
jgi:hypothetical protein